MSQLKQSSKLFIFHPEKGLYVMYRAPGPWTNPNSISFLGSDGGEITNESIKQIQKKTGLSVEIDAFTKLAEIPNPANNEINNVFKLQAEVDSMTFSPSETGGIMCVNPLTMWEFVYKEMISPAALTIIQGMPQIFGEQN